MQQPVKQPAMPPPSTGLSLGNQSALINVLWETRPTMQQPVMQPQPAMQPPVMQPQQVMQQQVTRPASKQPVMKPQPQKKQQK